MIQTDRFSNLHHGPRMLGQPARSTASDPWRDRRFASLHAAIGRTPLVELRARLHGQERVVFAKLESRNLSGSIKDRMALRILESATASGALRPDGIVVEATSGNAGIAFATLGRALGHDVRIHMPDWMSTERQQLLRGLGAELVLVSREEGGFLASIEQADAQAASDPHVFRPQQFDSPWNVRAHAESTGPELTEQLGRLGLVPTAFVAGVGTGGTVMGVGEHLRTAAPGASIHPLEPADSPTLRMGRKIGSHRIQGISDDFVPSIVDLPALDAIVDVRDGDAIRMAQRLARELGLAVGISSGANLLGALRVAWEEGPASVVTTVLPDGSERYLSTDLAREEPAREGDLTDAVELVDFQLHRME